jgi:predicted O-linked N-acetylglucosamine transferase (SPINDLY family)
MAALVPADRCPQEAGLTSADELFAEARRHHEQGRLAEAEAFYERALAADPAHTEALQHLGTLDFRAGRYEIAEARLRQALALRPRYITAHVNLGRILRVLDRPAEAAASYQSALALHPFVVAALIGLSDAWLAVDRLAEAIDPARKAVAMEPDNADTRNALGAALLANRQPAEALEHLDRALALKPDEARTHYNRGVALQALDRNAAALDAYRRAIELDPDLAEARNNLGMMLTETGELAVAIEQLRLAAEQAPQRSAIHNNLGKALIGLGRYDEALASFAQALELAPNYAEASANASAAWRGLGRLAEAMENAQRALAINPELANGHANLAVVLRDLGRFDEANSSLERAIELRPSSADLQAMRGVFYNDRGLHREALASCRQALTLQPGSLVAHQKLLSILPYIAEIGAAERFAEHRRFGARFGNVRPAAPGFPAIVREPQRRLRIGYLSSDLRGNHSVARNLRPFFADRDRSRFEVVAYAEVTGPDRTTDDFRGLADAWRSTVGVGDADVAKMVADDRIDILVSVAGHFDRNRTLVPAYAGAPLHVSLFDSATSGMAAVDYVLADARLVPRDTTERFVERVLRVPHLYIHDPMEAAPAIGPLPILKSGQPTFGCFNNPAKLSDECLALWARVLVAVPRARLLLRFRNWYGSRLLRERVLARLSAGGVAADRIEILPADTPGIHHLDLYNRVDVALDSHPFTGSTTTFEALWMGVPVITLAADTLMSRWSAAMLDALKLPGLVAGTPAAYVALAAALATDGSRLAELRGSLRSRVAGSPLCQAPQRVRQVERLYRSIWRRWCAEDPKLSP